MLIAQNAISSSVSDNRLQLLIKQWRSSLNDSASGPLLVAENVVDIAKKWEEYKKDANGKECSSFLKTYLGKDLSFFIRRQRAIEVLGKTCKEMLHHEAAVWLSTRTAQQNEIENVMRLLQKQYGANNSNVLSESTVKRIAVDAIGEHILGERMCSRCEMLENMLLEHGISIP